MKKDFFYLTFLTAILSTFAVSASESENQTAKESKLHRNTGHYIYVSGGVSHILSDVDIPFLTSGEPRLGGNIQVGYEWISAKKVGVGFMYDAYLTNFTAVMPTDGGWSSRSLDENLSFHYFAPQFAGRILLPSKRWALRCSIGIGLLISSERIKEDGKAIGANYDYGYGTNISFGVEWHLSSNVGLIGGIALMEGSIDQKFKDEKLNTNGDLSGISRINLDLGLIYRF